MCTDFLLLAGDASVVNGRSMEFGSDLKSELLIGGRGTEKLSPTPDLKDELHWTARYGYVGMNAYGKKIITDGMNEVGLSIGALWLPRHALPAYGVQPVQGPGRRPVHQLGAGHLRQCR